MGNIIHQKQAIKFLPTEIQIIKQKFCLEHSSILEFSTIFDEIDLSNKGYLEIDDLVLQFSQYDENFVELPYLLKLFTIIQKVQCDKIFFDQFMIGITVFCLMSNQFILQFIFSSIDQDQDGKISKNDMIDFVQSNNPKTLNYTFFENFVEQIENFKIRNDRNNIDFEEFRVNSDKFHFLVWPAFQLQWTFRQRILGISKWEELYSKAQKKQYQNKSNEKKQAKFKQKVKILENMKLMNYNGPFIKESYKGRKSGEIGSDTKLQPIAKRLKRRSVVYRKIKISLFNSEDN